MLALSPQPLPNLAPGDHPLFDALIRHSLNLPALAAAVSRPLHDLLAWASTPRIRAWVAAYVAHQAIADQFERGEHLSRATRALVESLKQLTDPIELRRAIATIVAATNSAARAAKAHTTQPNSPTDPALPAHEARPSRPTTAAPANLPAPLNNHAAPTTTHHHSLTPQTLPRTNSEPTSPTTAQPGAPAATIHASGPDPLSRHPLARPRPAASLLARAGVPP